MLADKQKELESELRMIENSYKNFLIRHLVEWIAQPNRIQAIYLIIIHGPGLVG